jgi:hypothetical protein
MDLSFDQEMVGHENPVDIMTIDIDHHTFHEIDSELQRA